MRPENSSRIKSRLLTNIISLWDGQKHFNINSLIRTKLSVSSLISITKKLIAKNSKLSTKTYSLWFLILIKDLKKCLVMVLLICSGHFKALKNPKTHTWKRFFSSWSHYKSRNFQELKNQISSRWNNFFNHFLMQVLPWTWISLNYFSRITKAFMKNSTKKANENKAFNSHSICYRYLKSIWIACLH